ncbi:hypothetical protein BH10ACT4_BH10ACT4_11370 [soil metagenome]
MDETAPPDESLSTGRRFVFLFATPWWRVVWVGAAIVWFVIVTVVVAIDPTHDQGLGALSVVPLFTVVFDVLRRSRTLGRK